MEFTRRDYTRRVFNPATSFLPTQVAQRYSFPPGDGTGIEVGIIELGGAFSQSDLNAYMTNAPQVRVVSVDGTNPSSSDADGEVMLDVCIIAMIAPKASISIYFAPNTDNGFLHAIEQACSECDVVSISWGSKESDWTPSVMQQFDQAFATAANNGVAVFAASGDNGSADFLASPINVDFPSSSPHVIGCGGTTITSNGEVVWNNGLNGGATGGGFSTVFSKPSWQTHSNSMRGIPDVAGVADPNSGWIIRLHGSNTVIGGTSAVAPMWAALVALVYQNLGKRIPNLNSVLYSLTPKCFTDIITGNNGAFMAGVGWDACTGLGVPIGIQLLKELGGNPPPPPIGKSLNEQQVLKIVDDTFAALIRSNARNKIVVHVLQQTQPFIDAAIHKGFQQ